MLLKMMLLPSDEAGMYIPFAFVAYDLFTELKFGLLSIIKIFKRNAQCHNGEKITINHKRKILFIRRMMLDNLSK